MKQSTEAVMKLMALKTFLTTLGAKHAALQHQRFTASKASLQAFLPKVGILHAPIQAARKRDAPDYNLFEVLKIRHYEAKVHTPFLVNLLSPWGSHEQGKVFYNAILDKLMPAEDPLRKPFLEGEVIAVTGEKYTTSFGYIDIWIMVQYRGKEYCMIIENKIYAGDQEKQLERYYQYARKERFEPDQIRLYYLTLWQGGRPSEYSIPRLLAEQLESQKILQYVSYRQDILPILRAVIPEIQANRLIINLEQYIQMVESL